jgi:hypothetical protein
MRPCGVRLRLTRQVFSQSVDRAGQRLDQPISEFAVSDCRAAQASKAAHFAHPSIRRF